MRQINPSRLDGLKNIPCGINQTLKIHSSKSSNKRKLISRGTPRVILNNSSIIQTSDRASTITRSFDLPLILVTKRVEVSRMHYFTNVSVPVRGIIAYRVSVETIVVCVCVCVCILNKVEVWSCAIAARGSYVRPESLLGTPCGNVC